MLPEPITQFSEDVFVHDKLLLTIEVLIVVVVEAWDHKVGCSIWVWLGVNDEDLPPFQKRLGKTRNNALSKFTTAADQN